MSERRPCNTHCGPGPTERAGGAPEDTGGVGLGPPLCVSLWESWGSVAWGAGEVWRGLSPHGKLGHKHRHLGTHPRTDHGAGVLPRLLPLPAGDGRTSLHTSGLGLPSWGGDQALALPAARRAVRVTRGRAEACPAPDRRHTRSDGAGGTEMGRKGETELREHQRKRRRGADKERQGERERVKQARPEAERGAETNAEDKGGRGGGGGENSSRR